VHESWLSCFFYYIHLRQPCVQTFLGLEIRICPATLRD